MSTYCGIRRLKHEMKELTLKIRKKKRKNIFPVLINLSQEPRALFWNQNAKHTNHPLLTSALHSSSLSSGNAVTGSRLHSKLIADCCQESLRASFSSIRLFGVE